MIMDQAVTVGQIFWFFVAIGGILAVGGVILWILGIIASGYNH